MTVKITKPEINVREQLTELRAGTSSTTTPNYLGRRNLIINGDMRIAQRGTLVSGVTSNNRIGPDRSRVDCSSSGTHTISQSTDSPTNFKYSWKLQCTTAQASPNQLRYSYAVEGNDVSHLGYGTSDASPLTLSFWVKSNVVGIYALSIETHVSSRYFSTNYTIDNAGVWEYKTIYIPGDKVSGLNADNTLGLYLSWWLASHTGLKTNPVDNTWVTDSSYTNLVGSAMNVNMASSTSNSWQITGVQLEKGKVDTPFEHRSYAEELNSCLRYYEDFQPGMFGIFGNGRGIGQSGIAVVSVPIFPKRTAPSVSMDALADTTLASRSGYSVPYSIGATFIFIGTRDVSTERNCSIALYYNKPSSWSTIEPLSLIQNVVTPGGVITEGQGKLIFDAEI